MHEAFFAYIQKFNSTPTTSAEKEQYREAFKPFKLRKRQYFLQEGDHCKYFAFVVKGAMRQYTVDEKGTEHIARLGIENWWVGDRESYIKNTPSIYNIDAWEDTQMLIVTHQSQDELRKKIPAYNEMLRRLDDNNNMANQRRINAAISASAEKRFIEFATSYPELLARFPQHIIASYLGFTKDTMSRIKAKLAIK